MSLSRLSNISSSFSVARCGTLIEGCDILNSSKKAIARKGGLAKLLIIPYPCYFPRLSGIVCTHDGGGKS